MSKLDHLVQEAMQSPPGAVQVAAPFNDTQLVCLVAAQCPEGASAQDAVSWAVELVVEAIAQMGAGGLNFQKAVQKRVAELRAHKGNGIIPG